MKAYEPAAQQAKRAAPLTKSLVFGLLIVFAIIAMVRLAHRATPKTNQNGSRLHPEHRDDHASATPLAAPTSKSAANNVRTKPDAPYGWTLKDGKLVPAPAPASAAPAPSPASLVPTAATGDPVKDWALEYERTENGQEADLVVRTGDINNL